MSGRGVWHHGRCFTLRHSIVRVVPGVLATSRMPAQSPAASGIPELTRAGPARQARDYAQSIQTRGRVQTHGGLESHGWCYAWRLTLVCPHVPQTINAAEGGEVIYSYDVVWERTSVKWASRWDIYLQMTDDKIHWFSIVNSVVIVVFLTGIVGLIMTRILRKVRGIERESKEERKR